jgi:hypothetical protein
MDLRLIAESWFDFIHADLYIKNLMQDRLAVCDVCTHKVQMNSLGEFIIKTINSKANSFKCKLCSCPLAVKTANPKSECPAKKWGIAGTEAMY